MKRRLFTILSALSLLLFAAAVVMWVRSYRAMEKWQWTLPDGVLTITASRGVWRVHDVTATWPGGTTTTKEFHHFRFAPAPALTSDGIYPGPRVGSWGAFGRATRCDRGVSQFVYLPHWLMPVAASALPLRWWLLYRGRWRGERRVTRGLCRRCGYDLRATPGRCPECGTSSAGVKA